MSKIKDALLQAEETEDFSDEQMEKWREETRKMVELDKEWLKVCGRIDGIVGRPENDHEFIEREISKGGRHDWR